MAYTASKPTMPAQPRGAEDAFDEPQSPAYRVTRHEIYEVIYDPSARPASAALWKPMRTRPPA